MNFFFNGETTNPGISVAAVVNGGLGPPFPDFFPNDGFTFALGPHPIFVSGADTLVFADGSSTVTLTHYSLFQPDIFESDRVGDFSALPDGTHDLVGTFTLQVVPEPASALLLGAGLFALAARRFTSGRDPCVSSWNHWGG